MTKKQGKFLDEKRNERPPYPKSNISLNILLFVTFFIGILFALATFMAILIGLSYHPGPTWKDMMMLGWALVAILPAIFLILGSRLRNFLGNLLLKIAVLIGFYFGSSGLWATITGAGDAWLFMTPVFYFVLIVLVVLKIRKVRSHSALK